MSPDSIKSIIKVEPPEPLLRRVASYKTLWALGTLTLVLDQLSKYWVCLRLPFGTYGPPDAIPVIDGFFNIIHVGNTGAAWSMLSGRSVLLAAIAAITLVAIYIWRKALCLKEGTVQIAFGLLCGGIIGNLVDRLHFGYVVDFIDLHFGSYIYPTFNVADSGICVGVVIYLWHSLFMQKH